MNNKKYYMLANLARSLDTYHTNQEKIHLVGSVFYTTNLDLDNFYDPLKLTVFISLTESEEELFEVVNHSGLLEIRINIFYFLNFISSENSRYNLANFILLLFGSHDINKVYGHYVNLNQIIFVFENINWARAVYLFKLANIQISGGSTNKRQILSNTQFNLSRCLSFLKFDINDVQASFGVLNENFKIFSNYTGEELSLNKIKLVHLVKPFLIDSLNESEQNLTRLNNEMSSNEGNKKELELKIKMEQENISMYLKSLANLFSESFDKLMDGLETDYFDIKLKDCNRAKNVLLSRKIIKQNKYPSNIFKGKRSYSTLVCQNKSSKYLRNEFDSRFSLTKANYTTKNSLIDKNLLKIIYSVEDKVTSPLDNEIITLNCPD